MTESATAPAWPRLSVVVPLRNEEKTLVRCLEAIAAQRWPPDRLEVLLVEGGSRDGTRAIAGGWCARDPRFRLLDNPGGLVSRALNLGIAAASGEIVVRIDAHTLPDLDYLERSVAALAETGAWCVGGPMSAEGRTAVGEAVALAMRHPFGVGPARFRYARRREAVDTVYLGAFPRAALERVGPFEERLVRNQDYEMNWRLRRAGGRIVVDPAIRSTYLTRSTLGEIWRQYFDYGFWKRRMLALHPRSLRPRQLVAPLFVLALLGGAAAAGGAALGALPRAAALALPALAGLYLALALGVSLQLAFRHGLRHFVRLPAVLATMHCAWGLGFLAASLWPWREGRAADRPGGTR